MIENSTAHLLCLTRHSDFERELNWLYSPLGNQGPSVRRRRASAQVTLHRALHPHRMESLRAPMRTSATTSVTQSQQADLQVGNQVPVHWTAIPHPPGVSERCSETPAVWRFRDEVNMPYVTQVRTSRLSLASARGSGGFVHWR